MGAVPSAFRLRSFFFQEVMAVCSRRTVIQLYCSVTLDYILAKMLAVSRITKRMEKQKLLPLLE
jgi:hypothetical protein